MYLAAAVAAAAVVTNLYGVGHVLRRHSEEVGADPRDEPDQSVTHAHPCSWRMGATCVRQWTRQDKKGERRDKKCSQSECITSNNPREWEHT